MDTTPYLMNTVTLLALETEVHKFDNNKINYIFYEYRKKIFIRQEMIKCPYKENFYFSFKKKLNNVELLDMKEKIIVSINRYYNTLYSMGNINYVLESALYLQKKVKEENIKIEDLHFLFKD